MNRQLVKDVIRQHGLLDDRRLRELEALAASSDAPLLDTILQGGHLREETLLPPLAAVFGLDWVDLDDVADRIDPTCWQELPDAVRTAGDFLPLYRDADGTVVVALGDPTDTEPLDAARNATGWAVRLLLGNPVKIRQYRDNLQQTREAATDDFDVAGDEAPSDRSIEALASEAPIIKQVNMIIMQAIAEGVSDIHIEPFAKYTSLRYRRDGVLREVKTFPPAQAAPLISRVKIMAELNIAERRIPQDGRITMRLMDRSYDLRVATTPSIHGEAVVLRILDKSNIMLDLSKLGIVDEVLAAIRRQIVRPHGILLVTGPTGSGKTTTLYAGLATIKTAATKIITIEDPVEYELDGILQIPVNPAVGMTFAAGLRSILRLDPDTVMVGEIRDGETAEIAIRAALTGHLVFSTLHTNDAVSAITRLLDMGVAPYLLAACLNGVLAQRLVRRVCTFCGADRPATEPERAMLAEAGVADVRTVRQGAGCDECGGTGYSGRIGLYEMLEVDDELCQRLVPGITLGQLRELPGVSRMVSLRTAGARLVRDGQTTIEELQRVTVE